MVLAVFLDSNGLLSGGLFDNLESYHSETFSPICKELFLFDFKVKGSNYRDKKSYLRDIAVEWSLVEKPMMYWGEIAYIDSFFERMGSRFGLLKEFRENVIC